MLDRLLVQMCLCWQTAAETVRALHFLAVGLRPNTRTGRTSLSSHPTHSSYRMWSGSAQCLTWGDLKCVSSLALRLRSFSTLDGKAKLLLLLFVVFFFFFFVFFFFHWHYNPLWTLACRKMSFHFSLSATNSLHLLTPST